MQKNETTERQYVIIFLILVWRKLVSTQSQSYICFPENKKSLCIFERKTNWKKIAIQIWKAKITVLRRAINS